MLFVIHPAAVDGDEDVLDALDAILVRVEDEVHEIEILLAGELEASRWYASSRSDRRKLLEGIVTASLHRSLRAQGPHFKRIEVSDANSARRARSIAHAPLLVLAENDVSDGALIEAALRMFGDRKTVALCFGAPSQLDPPSFQIESRGGHGELTKLLEKRLDDAKVRGRPPRLVVVTDSDGEWVGDVKEHAKGIRAECVTHGIPCPPLNKRTAENYIPDSVLQAWAAVPEHTSARPAIEALLRLSPTQRDYVHMAKSGASPWDPSKPEVVALFQAPSISSADRDLIEHASLKGRGDTMVILALQRHRAALTPNDLQHRDHQNDLKTLVRHIEDEL